MVVIRYTQVYVDILEFFKENITLTFFLVT